MPEIKKETTVDPVKKLGEYKSAIAELSTAISREKSRASVIMASIKAKRDALVAKAKEEKLKAEQKADETKTVEVKSEEVATCCAESSGTKNAKRAKGKAGTKACSRSKQISQRYGAGDFRNSSQR